MCKSADYARLKAKAHAAGRDTALWRRLREHIIRRDGRCRRCGTTADLTAHFLGPGVRHTREPGDYVALCRSCHWTVDAPRAHRH